MTRPPQIFEPDYYEHLHTIEERHWWAAGMRDLMAAWLDRRLAGRPALRALDVGCGTGLMLNWLRRYPLAGEAVGVDLSTYALAFARRRGAAALIEAAAERMPLPPGRFDLIVCLDTLQHVSPAGADRLAVAGFARLLRPGGYLYLRANSALGHAALRGVDATLYRRYRLPELAALMRESGLRVERASYANCLPAVWAMWGEFIAANRRPSPAIGPGLSIRTPRWGTLNSLLRGVLRVEAWLVGRLGMTLPFGHSTVILARKP